MGRLIAAPVRLRPDAMLHDSSAWSIGDRCGCDSNHFACEADARAERGADGERALT